MPPAMRPRLVLRALPIVLLGLGAVLTFAACDRDTPAPSGAASLASATASAAVSAPPRERSLAEAMSDKGDEVKPVYPMTTDPPLPIARRLCKALHDLPAARRAACCSASAGFTQSATCERSLSQALGSGAVTLDEGAVATCEKAMEKRHEGCDWVSIGVPPPAPECLALIHGTLAVGAPCRSSLECKDGLSCDGVGPTTKGVCGQPKPLGSVCGGRIDPLAGPTRQLDADVRQPECEGICRNRRCEAPVAVGGACKGDLECGPGGFCAGGKCSKTPPAIGQACALGCAGEGRCVKGKCAAPKAAGEACEADRECLGACVKGEGGARVCGQRCSIEAHW